MPITTNKDMGDDVELAVDTQRRHLGVHRGRGSKRLESLAEIGEKLPREAQCGAKHHLCSGEADPLLGGGPEPQEDPRKVLVPEGSHAWGTEGVLQGTVEPFDHPVGLRVVGSGLMMGDTKDCTEALPKGRYKLGTAIGGQMGRDSKTRDPVRNEGVGTVGGSGGGHGNGLRPPGGAVHDHDGEDVLRRREARARLGPHGGG